MKVRDEIFFPPFRLDLVNEQLFRGERQLQVRPKNFAVLRQLVEHAGQVVRKEDLIKAIWGKYESEGVLKQSIFQLREQLEDDAEDPRFIETVPRGYRFIAEVKRWLPQEIPLPPNFVGRSEELAQLQRWAELAKRGERQMIFVTGEPGIGKTTLLDAIVAQFAADPTVWIGRGQCIEQYGEGEAYLPILEALGRIGRRAGSEQFSAFLGRYAPTWLAQLPALVDEEKQEALQRRVQGATRQRMLRELVEAIEIFTSEETAGVPPTLVLILEDLQWSDYSTLDLLASLARRKEPARLLILGTYRPAEGLVEGHPLRAITQELQGHGQCQELALRLLHAESVEAYLEKRFPASALPSRFAETLYRLTNGNPLFLVTIIDDLVRQSILVEVDGHWVLQNSVDAITASVPDNIRQLVNRQIDRLARKEQRILEAASIAGLEFSTAMIAAAIEAEATELETHCEALVRRKQFLQPAGRSEWPDGTVSSHYSFRHALYQYLWQERVSPIQQQRFHLRIAERQEAAYGSRANEIAAELAIHFQQGGASPHAIRYFGIASEKTLRQSAHPEAIRYLSRALDLLKGLPDSPQRLRQEVVLRSTLGIALQAIKGYGATDVQEAFSQTRDLVEQVQDPVLLFRVRYGLFGFHLIRAEHRIALELAEQLLHLAQKAQDPGLLLHAHGAVGLALFSLGELLPAREQIERSQALYDPQQHASHLITYGQDPIVVLNTYSTYLLWALGYPDQAIKSAYTALTAAQNLSHAFSENFSRIGITIGHQLRGEVQQTQEHAETLISLSQAQGFPFWESGARILKGWTLATAGQAQEGISAIRQGLTMKRAIGAELTRPYFFALLVEACQKARQFAEGFAALEEIFAELGTTEERWWEADLHRLKGELLLQSQNRRSTAKNQSAAEECFHQALTVARRQSAKSLELRVAMSLCQLWRQQGNIHEAKHLLSDVYQWFTEGFDTADLQAAKTLLASFS